MNKTPDQLLDGALLQFRTHGFARTSMSDIAKAAGMSRTALYNHFETKEAVFKALSDRINMRAIEAVTAAARTQAPWQARLAGVVHARCDWVYDLLHDGAFGRELIDEKNRLCGGKILSANDQFTELLTNIIRSGGTSKGRAVRVAGVLVSAINGILEAAETRQAARADVEVFVDTFARGLSGGASGQPG